MRASTIDGFANAPHGARMGGFRPIITPRGENCSRFYAHLPPKREKIGFVSKIVDYVQSSITQQEENERKSGYLVPEKAYRGTYKSRRDIRPK